MTEADRVEEHSKEGMSSVKEQENRQRGNALEAEN